MDMEDISASPDVWHWWPERRLRNMVRPHNTKALSELTQLQAHSCSWFFNTHLINYSRARIVKQMHTPVEDRYWFHNIDQNYPYWSDWKILHPIEVSSSIIRSMWAVNCPKFFSFMWLYLPISFHNKTQSRELQFTEEDDNKFQSTEYMAWIWNKIMILSSST